MIDEALARSIDCRVVAGAANNPLTSREVARTLHAAASSTCRTSSPTAAG